MQLCRDEKTSWYKDMNKNKWTFTTHNCVPDTCIQKQRRDIVCWHAWLDADIELQCGMVDVEVGLVP